MKIKEVILDYLKEHPSRAYAVEELAMELDLTKAADFKFFVKTLASLEGEGLLEFTKNGKVKLSEVKAELVGVFRANANGFGFVTVDSDEPDVFIPKGRTAFALDGDEVKVELKTNANPLKGTSAEGVVTEVLKRAVTQLVGTFVKFDEKERKEFDRIGYVKSRNKKIPYHVFLTDKGLQPEDKAIVRVDITAYPDKKNPKSMQGLATEIVGEAGDKGIDVLEVLASLGIRSEFPADVLAQADAVPEEVNDKDIMGRVDYRNEITFTIDGADAKDLDDAVHIKRLGNGNFELGVHIADVSHYVTENSPLDREAFERGTSVYVADRVVPMLPERLSNGICSLNPRVNRLTQSCVMEINAEGKVLHSQIGPSIIKTTERMTYDDVNLMLDGDQEALTKYEAIKESVEVMSELHEILAAMRRRRGAIDFETMEARIIVDENGLPIEIRKRSRGTAERMIESFMLVANETVATSFETRHLPGLYRIHEHPKEEKMTRFLDFAATFGLQVKGTSTEVSQKALQEFLKKVKGQPGELVLSTMLLRSMQQARYSEDNYGHFGLAAENYTHFTSPIRRYPDLIVHRLIREMAQPSPKTIEYWAEKIPEIAQQSSNRERRAVDAEREVEKMKKAEFMEKHVGEEFEGVIASVTRFGMFIELENTIEGLVHISTIKGEYMNFHERMMALVGERTGLVFRIGQPIKIQVTKADKVTGDIDFEYIKSDLDVVESNLKSKKEKDSRRRPKANRSDKKDEPKSSRHGQHRSENSKGKKYSSKNKDEERESRGKGSNNSYDKKSKKKKKPFYAAAAKGKFGNSKKKKK
ncbi:ribonuclease R [Lactococcus garvieae]|uniref:ribonuclease R n=1 Tax=Lactococcus garvieae TaxID=1363 RepID=UPI0018D6EAED|nr:ribonuclease R [Lactococcus garvieae]QPS71550.1 ribonuclease R [Lactococcus garvieae]